jgi:hypothetical protein
MNVTNLKNCDAVLCGEFQLDTKIPSKKKKDAHTGVYAFDDQLVFDWVDSISFNKNKKLSIVYFFVSNGEIVKIGQTSGKNGVKGCLNFYMKAGCNDDAGPNRFYINCLIREELEAGKSVEFYVIYTEPFLHDIPTLMGKQTVEIAGGAKEMEEKCMKQYHASMGCYPRWNLQESDIQFPTNMTNRYNDYRKQRQLIKEHNSNRTNA